MNKSLREINSRRLLRYNGRIVYLCFKMAYSLGKPITKGRPAQETGHKPNERNKIVLFCCVTRVDPYHHHKED